MSGNFLSCLKDVQDPFEAQEGRWDFSRDAAAEKASSCVEGRISWFFSTCSSKLGVPLKLRLGPQGPTRGGFRNVQSPSELRRASRESSAAISGAEILIWS